MRLSQKYLNKKEPEFFISTQVYAKLALELSSAWNPTFSDQNQFTELWICKPSQERSPNNYCPIKILDKLVELWSDKQITNRQTNRDHYILSLRYYRRYYGKKRINFSIPNFMNMLNWSRGSWVMIKYTRKQ